MMELRRKVVLVAGDGANPHREKSTIVGEWIARGGYHLLTGGGGGVMSAVTESFIESAGKSGVAIGVIPGSVAVRGSRLEYRTKGSAYPNHFVDIAVFTHLIGEDPEGEGSRNHINVLSADLVVALPGGTGTNAEIQLAKRYGKPVILFLGAKETISGKTVDALADEGFSIARDFPSLIEIGQRLLGEKQLRSKPVRLELEKCVVRSWQWTDAESLQRYANNRRISRNLNDAFPSPYTVRDARRWLTHALCSSPETAFAIEVDGHSVGGIGFLLKQDVARAAEVGYWLGEPYWGRGITTDCVRAVNAYIFDNFPYVCRLFAQVFPWNKSSMRVLEKAGFTHECVLRKAAVKGGDVIDIVQYALVREL